MPSTLGRVWQDVCERAAQVAATRYGVRRGLRARQIGFYLVSSRASSFQ